VKEIPYQELNQGQRPARQQPYPAAHGGISAKTGTKDLSLKGSRMTMNTTALDQSTAATLPADKSNGAATTSQTRRGILASLSPLELMLVARAKIQRVAEGTATTSFIGF
jgi:hypothetical protein